MVAEHHLSSSFWLLSSHSSAPLLCSCKRMCRVFILNIFPSDKAESESSDTIQARCCVGAGESGIHRRGCQTLRAPARSRLLGFPSLRGIVLCWATRLLSGVGSASCQVVGSGRNSPEHLWQTAEQWERLGWGAQCEHCVTPVENRKDVAWVRQSRSPEKDS